MNARAVPVLLALTSVIGAAEGPREWNNLGARRYAAHDFAGAEQLYQRALSGWREISEPRGEARTMSNLAVVYRAEGRYGDAEELYREALDLLDRTHFGAGPEAVTTLNNLAELYRYRGEAARGEPYARQSIALAEHVFGAGNPAAADGLHTLAAISRELGRLDEALALYGRARTLLENAAPARDALLAANLANTAEIRMAQGAYAEAESLSRRALEVAGPAPPARAQSLNNLAQSLRLQGRYGEAEPLYREALAKLGDDAVSGRVLANFAGFYHDQGRENRAVELYTRAVAALEASLGPDHPETALVRTRLAEVRRAQGHFAESIALYRQALPLLERVYGTRDPRVVGAEREFERAASEARRYTVAAQ